MTKSSRYPAVVAHCDWSMYPSKRWMAVAVRQSGGWRISEPEPVGDTSSLFSRLAERKQSDGSVLAGFDFPIGLPAKYGALTGLSDFNEAIRQFGRGDWPDWYSVAEHQSEISIRRPFYPMRPGGTRRAHLLAGLGVLDRLDLLRLCERATDDRNAACALFWTLGGSQVGKAALTGWKELIVPNVDIIGLWPFKGALQELINNFELVVAETYPGDVYRRIGIPRSHRWSKRKVDGRRSVAGYLDYWIGRRAISMADGLHAFLMDGLSPSATGEDQFDAIVGLFGMLDVVDGLTPEGVPDLEDVRRWEGWILGQSAQPSR